MGIVNRGKKNEVVKPVMREEEVIVPRYKFVDKIVEIPKLVEKPVDSVSKKDLELLKDYGRQAADLFEMLQKLKNYKIEEEIIRVQKPVFVDREIINPVFKNKELVVTEYRGVEKTFEIPKIVEKPVEGISEKDLELVRGYVQAVKELKTLLAGLKDYKIQEEIVRIERPVFREVVKEIQAEKVVWIVKDELIDTLEDLVKKIKKTK